MTGVGNTELAVLHVDDDPQFVRMVAEFLEGADDRFTVETATSASDGLDRLAETEFDCVVSDYNMPDRNGIRLLETVRESHPDLPFILYTGKGSEEVASEAISAGVTDYLQKEGGVEQYELLANRIENTVEQYHATRRAATLERLGALSSDVNQALIRASSREELETRVCDVISEADPYVFTWIGEVDPGSETIDFRTSAGTNGGYLDDLTITADETPTGRGPAGTAIRERRVAVSQDVRDDPRMEPWRQMVVERGYRSVAVVPLAYEEHLYGVLAVYADRSGAFDDAEQSLLAELGDDIAHALHSFRIRERLREERDRRTALFENAQRPVIAGDIRDDGDRHLIGEVNDAFEEVFGYDAQQIVGRDVADVVLPDEERTRHEQFRERATAGEPIQAEVERITTDGARAFLLDVFPFGLDDEPADGWYAWFTDITERKERKRELQRQNERLEEFAGVISHDLQNPLNVALGHLEIARTECDSDHLDAVSEAHGRMQSLIENLLTLARENASVSDLEAVDLATTVETCWRTVATADATLVTDTRSTIRADRGRLMQLLENLIGNAVEHGGEDVTVTVGDLASGAGFYVADDGPGIPGGDSEQVFTMGYSTTENGTGFGLSIVKEIAEAHEWAITVTDSGAGGARFEITGVDAPAE